MDYKQDSLKFLAKKMLHMANCFYEEPIIKESPTNASYEIWCSWGKVGEISAELVAKHSQKSEDMMNLNEAAKKWASDPSPAWWNDKKSYLENVYGNSQLDAWYKEDQAKKYQKEKSSLTKQHSKPKPKSMAELYDIPEERLQNYGEGENPYAGKYYGFAPKYTATYAPQVIIGNQATMKAYEQLLNQGPTTITGAVMEAPLQYSQDEPAVTEIKGENDPKDKEDNQDHMTASKLVQWYTAFKPKK